MHNVSSYTILPGEREGRDEKFRKLGWLSGLAICREQGDNEGQRKKEGELMGQKSTEGLFHFFELDLFLHIWTLEQYGTIRSPRGFLLFLF